MTINASHRCDLGFKPNVNFNDKIEIDYNSKGPQKK